MGSQGEAANAAIFVAGAGEAPHKSPYEDYTVEHLGLSFYAGENIPADLKGLDVRVPPRELKVGSSIIVRSAVLGASCATTAIVEGVPLAQSVFACGAGLDKLEGTPVDRLNFHDLVAASTPDHSACMSSHDASFWGHFSFEEFGTVALEDDGYDLCLAYEFEGDPSIKGRGEIPRRHLRGLVHDTRLPLTIVQVSARLDGEFLEVFEKSYHGYPHARRSLNRDVVGVIRIRVRVGAIA